MLGSVETMKKKGFCHHREDAGAMQALLGKCVFLVLTANSPV